MGNWVETSFISKSLRRALGASGAFAKSFGGFLGPMAGLLFVVGCTKGIPTITSLSFLSSVPPEISFQNVPGASTFGLSNDPDFNVQVMASKPYQAYRFAFVSVASTESPHCETGLFSGDRLLTQSISSADVATLTGAAYSDGADGVYALCVYVKDENGSWGEASASAFVQWKKDTQAQRALILTLDAQHVGDTHVVPLKGNNISPTLRWSLLDDEGAKVEVFKGSACSPSQRVGLGTVSQGLVETVVDSQGLQQRTVGDNDLYVRTTDLLNQKSTCDFAVKYRLDSVKPIISGFSTVPGGGTYGVGGVLNFTATFSEPVFFQSANGDGTMAPPKLQLLIGNPTTEKWALSSLPSPSPVSSLSFSYTVEMGDEMSSPNFVGSPLSLPSSLRMVDEYGNNLDPIFSSPNTAGVLIETQGPQIVSITNSANDSNLTWYKSGSSLEFKVNFSKSVFLSGGGASPSLSFAICDNSDCSSYGSALTAPYSSGSGSSTLVFHFMVATGADAPYGLKILSLSAGDKVLADASGNLANLLEIPAGSLLKSQTKLDGHPPSLTSVSLNSGAVYSTSESLSLGLAGVDDTASGTYIGSGVSTVIYNTTSCTYNGAWTPVALNVESPMVNLTVGRTSGVKTLFVKVQDAAGNQSACKEDSITLDVDPPSVTGVSLGGGATYTKTLSVSLSYTLADVGSGYNYYLVEAGACGSQPQNLFGAPLSASNGPASFATTYTLQDDDGNQTVSVWLKDQAGNLSCSSDSIILDRAAPSLATFATNPSDDDTVNANNSTLQVTSFSLTESSGQYSYAWKEVATGTTPSDPAGGEWSVYYPLNTPPANFTITGNGARDIYLFTQDLAGNFSSRKITITRDGVAPGWTSFARTSPVAAVILSQIDQPTFSFTATAAVAVGDVFKIYDGNDCSVPGTGVEIASRTATIAGVQTYTGVESTMALAEGPHTFSLRAKDSVGNETCIHYASSPIAYTIDQTAPSISGLTVSAPYGGAWFGAGDTMSFQVQFSEAVAFQSVTQLSFDFDMAGGVRTATCAIPGTTTQVISCSYSVGAEVDADGVSVLGETTLNHDGLIKDLAGNAFAGSLGPSLRSFPAAKVDGVPPSITGVNFLVGGQSTTANSTDLKATPPLTWADADDGAGSGIARYEVVLLDGNSTELRRESFLTSSSSGVVMTGLNLTDTTTSAVKFTSYALKLVAYDQAGNSAVTSSRNLQVVQWTPGGPMASSGSSSLEGAAVGLSDDGLRVIVGAPGADEVKVYQWNGGPAAWSLVKTFAGGTSGAEFGASVAIKSLVNGDYLYAIGAPSHSNGNTEGAVFVYKETGSGGFISSPVQSLYGAMAGDEFGRTTKFLDTFLIVGVPGFDGGATDGGEVRAYALDTWASTVVDTGALNGGLMGKVIATTMRTAGPTIYSNSGRYLYRYTYSTGVWNSQVLTPGWSIKLVSVMDAEGDMLAAYADSTTSLRLSANAGTTFASLSVSIGGGVSLASVAGVAFSRDIRPPIEGGIGSFLMLYTGSASASRGIHIFDVAGTSTSPTLNLKQTLFSPRELTNSGPTPLALPGLAGSQGHWVIGDPLLGTFYPYK